jgi:dipeptidyl aminopeptidase/acylaminoacyl peptidase
MEEFDNGLFHLEPLEYSLEGRKLTGYITFPARTSGDSIPGVLLVHGGPGLPGTPSPVDDRPPLATARGILDARLVRKHLCSRYAVLSAEFVSAYPGDPASPASIKAAWSALAAWPGVDPSRIALIGPSHGGYVALMSMLKHPFPIRPACAAAVSPFTHLGLILRYWDILEENGKGIGKITTAALNQGKRLLGWPWRRDEATRARYEALSPLCAAGALDTPMMLVHGRDDRIVPCHHTLLLSKALDGHGRRHRLLLTRGEEMGGHFLFGLNDDAWREMEGFLGEYLDQTK